MASVQENLQRYGQEHLLAFAEQLSEDARQSLFDQVAEIDFEQLKKLTSGSEKAVDWAQLAKNAGPPTAFKLLDANPTITAEQAAKAGREALAAGKVGMILVAGGQGTRLGFDKPKGMFPIGPLSERTLFQMHCDQLLAVMRRYDVEIPLYIMTSPATDHETRAYFAANNNCDLPEHLLNIFCQGTMPAVDDASGKVLLKSKHEISISPDGHGGLVAAMAKHGCLEDAESRGIDLFYYAQVDNPMAQICEPALLGYHLLASSQMTTQVVKKRFATEKVGNVVTIDGKTQIIEYSDLPPEVAELTNEDGSLKFWAGNIAIHVFDRTFLQSVVDDAEGLPFHRAHKKVPYIDEQGNVVQPDDPNAIKFERFVFDLLPLAKNAIVVEGDPAEVFAPVKNADGGPVDTPSDTQDALLSLHRRWLTDAGAKIEEDVEIEIHPAWALDAGEVASKLEAGTQFTADTFLR